ncbi:hypothetical protein [Yersinia bercovieri]|uniref:hypothetical protein n=1 Tax=Yersinia bercovieri TaxID=634 RepID=UPI00119F7F19|nr:hypothetical protein [Yersinia bercovieri]
MSTNYRTTVKSYAPPPLIEARNTLIPSFRIIDALPDGVILKENENNDLVVRVDSWQNLKDTPPKAARGAMRVYMVMDTDAEPEILDPPGIDNYIVAKGVDAEWTQDEKNNGFTMTIDKKYFINSDENNHYVMLYIMPVSGNVDSTIRKEFTLLKKSSGGVPVAPLIFDTIYSTNGITELNLVNNAKVPPEKVLPVHIHSYFDMRQGDKISLFFGASSDNLLPVPDADVIVSLNQLGQDIPAEFNQSLFNGEPDGPHFFSYTITNEAGYTSDPAEPVMLQLAFGDFPAGLKPPVLPDIADNFIINDFIHPLRIDIPAYDNVQVQDIITLHFKDDKGVDVVIKSSPPIQTKNLGSDPIFTFFPVYDEIIPYDKKSVIIYYVVSRGDSSIKKTASRELVAGVDLSIPAEPNPDPDSPENGNLRLLTIFSDSNEQNKITGPAVNKDARVFIPFQTVKNANYLLVGDVITVTWGAVTLAPFKVTTIPTAQIIITLPAADILASGGGHIPAHYTVTRLLVDNIHSSSSVSPKIDILVNSTNTNPGGKDGLQKPLWLFRNKQNTINIKTINDTRGCIFSVLKYENIRIGQIIILKLRGTEGFEDVNGPAVDNADYDSPPYEITAVNIGLDEHEFLVPAAPFYTLCQGVVHATYTVQESAGGEVFNSLELVEFSDMKLPTQNACGVPPVFN